MTHYQIKFSLLLIIGGLICHSLISQLPARGKPKPNIQQSISDNIRKGAPAIYNAAVGEGQLDQAIDKISLMYDQITSKSNDIQAALTKVTSTLDSLQKIRKDLEGNKQLTADLRTNLYRAIDSLSGALTTLKQILTDVYNNMVAMQNEKSNQIKSLKASRERAGSLVLEKVSDKNLKERMENVANLLASFGY